MKKLIFTLLICVSAFVVRAQIGYNYNQYEIGGGVAFNKMFSDFVKSPGKAAFVGNFTYNQTPFINFVAELQVGSVTADSLGIVPGSAFYFNTNYTSVAFKAQVQAGELMDYSRSQFGNFFKNFYLSAGVGVIYTKYNLYDTGSSVGEVDGSNIFIPIKAGYEIKFFNSYDEPTTRLDLGYQLNYIMTDNFDGIPYGKFNDAIGQIVIGLKFSIGGRTSYRKPISF